MQHIDIYNNLLRDLTTLYNKECVEQSVEEKTKYENGEIARFNSIIFTSVQKIEATSKQRELNILEKNLIVQSKTILGKLLNCKDVSQIKQWIDTMKDTVYTVIQTIEPTHIDFDTIFDDISKNKVFASKYVVDQVVNYECRKRLFEDVIKKNLKFDEGIEVCRKKLDCIFIILRLPYTYKKIKSSGNSIRFLLNCAFAGKPSARKARGVGCDFQVKIIINSNGNNEIDPQREHCEVKDIDANKLNHMRSECISKWITPLTTDERQRVKVMLKIGLTSSELLKLHPELKLRSDQIMKIKSGKECLDSNGNPIVHEDQILLDTRYVETNDDLYCINVMNDTEFHSMIYINKCVSQMSYSQKNWLTDTTYQILLYNLAVQLIATVDENNKTQLVGYAVINSEDFQSFRDMFQQVKDIVKYSPEIFIVDRGISQEQSIEDVFPDSSIVYCLIHIDRCINRYFANTIVSKVFKLYIQKKITLDKLIDTWKRILENNEQQMEEDEDNDEYYESTEESSSEEEGEEESFDENELNDLISKYEENEMISNGKKKKVLEETTDIDDDEVNAFRFNKGAKCLRSLIETTHKWAPTLTVTHALYKLNNTNRVEGLIGVVKKMLQHHKVSLTKFLITMKALSKLLMNRKESWEVSDNKIIDMEDPKYRMLTPFCKHVLNCQYNLAKKKKKVSDKAINNCRSCTIRKSCSSKAWPCWHIMKERIRSHSQFVVSYDDIPARGFLPKKNIQHFRSQEEVCRNYRVELNMQKMRKVNGIMYRKKKHESNAKQRNKVDRYRKPRKQIIEEFGEENRKRKATKQSTGFKSKRKISE